MTPKEPNNLDNEFPENKDTSSNTSIEDKSDLNRKKKPKRRAIWILLLVIILSGSYLTVKMLRPNTGGPRINPLNLVPSDAFFIMETDEPYTAWSSLSNTKIWKTLIKDEDWREYGEIMQGIEENMASFDMALDMLDDRSVLLSGHLIRKNDYDFLYVLDMEGLAVVRTLLTTSGNLTKRQFEDFTIYESLDIHTKSTLYFTFIDNFLVGSYTHSLVEKSIIEHQKAPLTRNLDFIEVQKETIGEGVVRMLINYEWFYQFIQPQLGESYTSSLKTNLPLLFGGLYFDLKESTLSLEGYSNYDDSLATYLEILENTGTSNLSIAEVLPATTSLYMSIGFEEFSDFYRELETHLHQDQEYGQGYDDYKKKTEKFLDISIQEDFVDWVDDELAIVQMERERSEVALVLKGKNTRLVREKMDFLRKQIKRKTPVRFKTVDYKGFEISFLSIKGLFNLVLGNLFTSLDRPYYTIINNYVIFSNSPQTLSRIIDDYLAKNTLAANADYQSFVAELGEKHSFLCYVQLPLLARSSGGLLSNSVLEMLQDDINLINDFPQFGVSLYPSRDLYKTRAMISINNVKTPEPGAYFMEMPSDTTNYDSLFATDPGEQLLISEIEIELEDLGAKKQTNDFENGVQQYEVEIKDGLKHGSYFEYHDTGELKIKGKYKNDLKEGTWKYYDIDGNLIKKEKYNKGDLIRQN